MADSRDTFTLSANGALTTGVKDRQNTAYSGSLTNLSATVGTAPTGGPLVFELRREGVVVTTVTIPAGQSEVNVDLQADISNPVATLENRNPQPTPPAYPVESALLRFGEGTTFDINVTTVGTTVAGSDLDVTVATAS